MAKKIKVLTRDRLMEFCKLNRNCTKSIVFMNDNLRYNIDEVMRQVGRVSNDWSFGGYVVHKKAADLVRKKYPYERVRKRVLWMLNRQGR
jgi:hypothetical protein